VEKETMETLEGGSRILASSLFTTLCSTSLWTLSLLLTGIRMNVAGIMQLATLAKAQIDVTK
jgi:hypothetical protein